MRKIVASAALVAAVVVVVHGCKRVNGAYCDDARPCANGSSCDLVARECRPSTIGGGSDMAGAGGGGGGGSGACGQCSGTTPLCTAGACIPCTSTSDGDGACAALSAATPHCASDGSCVGCRDAADCGGTTPFCDATTHLCRGCIADNECPSLVCDLTPTSTTRGQCVDAAKVAYADINGPNGNGLTAATAKTKIQDAINVAVGAAPARPYVRIAAGTYNESVGVTNATIYLVGATGAIIHPTGGGKDALGAQMSGSLTVRNLVATADGGNGGNCASSATFAAYHSQFINSAQTGFLEQTTCGSIVLDGCWIHGNSQGGVSLGNKFTIINSIITKNVGGGVNQLGTAATQIFVNNTVADNTSGALNAGVACLAVGGFAVTNTILYDNKSGGTVSESNCSASFDASDDPSAGPQSTVDLTMQMPMFKATVPLSPDSYHLVAGSKCINEGTSTGVPDHDYDFQPRPDATSKLVDIGADEVP